MNGHPHTPKPTGPVAPYVHEEYPKMLYDASGAQKVANDPEQETALKEKGFSEEIVRPEPKDASLEPKCPNCKKLIEKFDAKWNEAQTEVAKFKIALETEKGLHAAAQSERDQFAGDAKSLLEQLGAAKAQNADLQAKLEAASKAAKPAKAEEPKPAKAEEKAK